MKAGVRYTVKVKSRRSLQAEANLTPFITLLSNRDLINVKPSKLGSRDHLECWYERRSHAEQGSEKRQSKMDGTGWHRSTNTWLNMTILIENEKLPNLPSPTDDRCSSSTLPQTPAKRRGKQIIYRVENAFKHRNRKGFGPAS